ncbi:TfuA domain-containing protein [Gammaproteobacteria bacterium]|nr:TfuA domain-containing protein [Gammaproteobacteria bacterium]
MTAYVFTGPTISGSYVKNKYDIVPLPPVAQGDIYRISKKNPTAIGIIDGFFSGVPAVWHKEILWALSQGIHVFGSASMGALRAAEMHSFGMRGVGRIFEDYRDGILEDDDEVAVLHGPAETGFKLLSEPMVNIRATLDRAVAEGVINARTSRQICNFVKGLFYQQRTWGTLFDQDSDSVLPIAECTALRDWLPAGTVDLKRSDAECMLLEMEALLQSDPEPVQVHYHFEWTHFWDEVTTYSIGTVSGLSDNDNSIPTQQVLDELRLDPDRYQSVKRNALLRLLSDRETQRRKITSRDENLRRRKRKFREKQELYSRQQVDAWLDRNNMDEHDLDRLLEEDERITTLLHLSEVELEHYCFSELRAMDDFGHLLQRALDKRDLLASMGKLYARPEEINKTPIEIRAWFFEQRLNRNIPDDLDEFLKHLAMPYPDRFYEMLVREWIYLDSQDQSKPPESAG